MPAAGLGGRQGPEGGVLTPHAVVPPRGGTCPHLRLSPQSREVAACSSTSSAPTTAASSCTSASRTAARSPACGRCWVGGSSPQPQALPRLPGPSAPCPLRGGCGRSLGCSEPHAGAPRPGSPPFTHASVPHSPHRRLLPAACRVCPGAQSHRGRSEKAILTSTGACSVTAQSHTVPKPPVVKEERGVCSGGRMGRSTRVPGGGEGTGERGGRVRVAVLSPRVCSEDPEGSAPEGTGPDSPPPGVQSRHCFSRSQGRLGDEGCGQATDQVEGSRRRRGRDPGERVAPRTHSGS